MPPCDEDHGRLPRPVHRSGIPLAPVARAVIDGARRLRGSRDVTELLADPVQQGLCTVADLARELGSGARRGSATPRRVLADVSAGVRSAAERDAKRLWRRTGLPEPRWNAPVHDARGRLLGVADAWVDEVAPAWKIDSYAWHLAPADYARTTERSARKAAAGVIVFPSLPAQLRDDQAVVSDELVSAYGNAAARPRPDVRAVPPTP